MLGMFTILVADKNKNVREFLRREFMAEGYSVKLVKDSPELFRSIFENPAPDLLICDLELPYANGLDSLEKLVEARPHLPIVIYSFLTEFSNHKVVKKAAAFLEKRGNDIDSLKETVAQILQNYYPG
ncbi:MAG: response regulator [Deltaproteobacteria bacterium]|nr:response regulator [Deltaproteobacteria bacterium]